MGTLDGKVAIITGAGRGIGRALALGFAGEGAKVVLVGRRRGDPQTPETLEHVARLVQEAGGTALVAPGNVADLPAMQQMALQTIAHFGSIDILVNNAGHYCAEGFMDTTLEQWQESLDGFMTGTFVCSKVVVPAMIQQGGGHIINMGSRGAESENLGTFAYSTVRAAMIRFTIKQAVELKPYNIAVNSVAPGFTVTERVIEVLGDQLDRSRGSTPEDVVPEYLWVAQQPISYTGNILYFDGFGKSWGPVKAGMG